MIRSILERVTRRSVFRRALPADVGGADIYVSGSAGLRYVFKRMDRVDPGLCRLAKEFVKAGSVVWDIGANVGLFTFSAAHLAGACGRVIAVEADLWLAQLLRKSAALQPGGSAPVDVIPAAAAQSVNIRVLNISSRSRASNSLEGYGRTQVGRVAEQQQVVSITLDWLAEHVPPPDVVKIDVEGAEREVLTGATGLLRERAPIILCEVGEDRATEVAALLHEAGYRLYDAEATEERQPVATAPWSTLAVRA